MSCKSIRVRTLSEIEQKKIEQLFRDPPDCRVHERALAIRLSSQGQAVPAIAGIVQRSRSTVWSWVNSFNANGISSLYMGKSPGAPPKADEEVEAAISYATDRNPRDLGYPFTRWTASLLAEHIRRTVHVSISTTTVYRCLHRLEYRYLRPKLNLKHKQDKAEVARAMREKKAAKKKSKEAPVVILGRISMRRNSISITS